MLDVIKLSGLIGKKQKARLTGCWGRLGWLGRGQQGLRLIFCLFILVEDGGGVGVGGPLGAPWGWNEGGAGGLDIVNLSGLQGGYKLREGCVRPSELLFKGFVLLFNRNGGELRL